ncbi:MAG: MFS transporter [Bacteroidales bacterium]|nr:MFS transporter [Bacteroidales bacterium]
MGTIKTKFSEKVGYGFGDMSSSMFWKMLSYYLPFFYSNVFGLRLDQVAILLMVTRIWDAVSDPMMGILADRTHTRWGKYRPYLLLMALPFALSGVFLFTTPDAGPTMKLVWAYITYIMMMTVYTGINVPYGAMLGVITDDSDTKTVLSSFRMFFAYGGSFIVLFSWEPLCNLLGGYNSPAGWQHSIFIASAVCLVLFLLCFRMTKEKLHTVSTASVGKDLKSLVRNAPWWILIGAALCSNLFNTLRGSTVAYFFNDVIGQNVHLSLGSWSFLFYAGLFLSIGEVCNMIGVALTTPIAKVLGKKTTYMLSFFALIVLSIAFFYIPVTGTGYWWMLVLQIVISIFTGIISPLVWSMYADVSDYAENRDGTASTALIFSSASMAQKFGGAFGGAAVMWILAAFGYNTEAGAVQTPEAIQGLKILMSWIPAAVSALAVVVVFFYPLTKKRMEKIQEELAVKRGPILEETVETETKDEEPASGFWKGMPKVMRWAFSVLAAIIVLEAAFAITRGTAENAVIAQTEVVSE